MKEFLIGIISGIKAETIEKVKSIATTTAETKAINDNTNALAKNAATRKVTQKRVASEATKTIAKENAKQTLAPIGSVAGAGQALGSLLVTAAPYIAAIAAITGAVYLLVKAYNKDADAAKRAKKNVESLSKVYEECANKAKELKQTISDYNDGIKQIQDLAKGTDEYAEALEKSNEKAKELIETYKLFDKYKIENGQIIIDENTLKEVQNQTEEQARNLSSSLSLAKINANKADIKSKTTDLNRELLFVDTFGEANRFGDEAITSLITALTKMEDLSILDTDTLKDRIKSDTTIADTIRTYVDVLFDSNGQLKESIVDLTEVTKEATKANQYYGEEIAENAVSSKYKEDLDKLATVDGKVDEGRQKQLATILRRTSENTEVKDGKTLQQLLEEIDVDSVTSNSKLNTVLKKTGSKESIDNDKDLALTYARLIKGITDTDLQYEDG